MKPSLISGHIEQIAQASSSNGGEPIDSESPSGERQRRLCQHKYMNQQLDVQTLLDPEISALLAASPIDLGAMLSSLNDESVLAIRGALGQMPQPALSGKVTCADYDILGRPGVKVRVHTPAGSNPARPCLVWMHGGGLVIGDYTMDDARFDQWCTAYDIIGICVEYRLAPEFAYPIPLEDCYAALAWVNSQTEKLGIDKKRIGVGGASAGSGLAAGLALLARDRGEFALSFQLLIYPMLDDRQITVSSSWADPIWPPGANTYAWTAYLGAKKGTAEVPIYAAPARAIDLQGLPPTLIVVGALDGFSDEDIDYAVRLRHAGVPTELHVYPGAPHGFESLAPDAVVSKQANSDVGNWLKGQTD